MNRVFTDTNKSGPCTMMSEESGCGTYAFILVKYFQKWRVTCCSNFVLWGLILKLFLSWQDLTCRLSQFSRFLWNQTLKYFCFDFIFINKYTEMTKFHVQEENQGLEWWPGAETESTDYFSRGPEFGPKH